jgi:hypothetical protein
MQKVYGRSGTPLEGVRKLAACASGRKDGCLAEVSGCGLSHGMGNHPFLVKQGN